MGAISALRLPSGKVSALLVLACLGFGVIIGNQASRPPGYTLASSARPHLRVVLPPASTASTASPGASAASSSSESSAGAEPPAAESEPTPTPAAAAPASKSSGKASAGSGTSQTSAGGGAEGGSGSSKSGSSKSGSSTSGSSTSGGSTSKLPPLKHVFVIMLSDQPYAHVFGPSSSSAYLSQTLEQKGELLVRYYAVAHEQLPNGIALISGQGPTLQTAANCPLYTAVAAASVGAEQQVLGAGCVYPSGTQTLAGQLAAKHLTWRAYVEGIGESPSAPACAHPALGASDPTSAQAALGEVYATLRDPFVYFQSVTNSPACAANVVGIGRLGSDLSNAKRTPSFSYIVPDGCRDGSPTPCRSGAAPGPGAANAYLQQLVEKILASTAYKESGLLVITTDEAPSTGEFADSSSCCGEPQFPNLPAPASGGGLSAKGGGQVGALLLSPFVKAGTKSQEPYNHFSLLRTIEDLFGLKHLGYAASSRVSSFEPPVFSAYTRR